MSNATIEIERIFASRSSIWLSMPKNTVRLASWAYTPDTDEISLVFAANCPAANTSTASIMSHMWSVRAIR